MSPPVVFLYYLCFTLLAFLAVYVLSRDLRSRLHQYFSLSTFFLLIWLLSLYLFEQQRAPEAMVWLGRLNFAAIALVAPFAYMFVLELTGQGAKHTRVLLLETLALSLLTICTPLIDQAERIEAGIHVTDYGPLFPVYTIHVALLLLTSAAIAFRIAPGTSPRLRGQLVIIGGGIAATTLVAIYTNVVLPYLFHDFLFLDVGALSTILVLASIGYAITVQHLFDIRVIIKKTVVLTLLLATVHALYSGVILLVTDALPPGAEQYRFELEVLNIMVLAFGFEPLKKFLEREVDRLLYRREHSRRAVLTELANRLTTASTLEQSLRIVLHTLEEEFHPRFAAVFVLEPGEGGVLKVKRLEHAGHVTSAKLLSLIREPLLTFLAEYDEPVCTHRLQRALQEEEARLRTITAGDAQQQRQEGHSPASESEVKQWVADELASRQIAAAVPVHIDLQLAGLLVLGELQSGEQFHAGDLTFLKHVAHQTAPPIQKMQSEFGRGRIEEVPFRYVKQ